MMTTNLMEPPGFPEGITGSISVDAYEHGPNGSISNSAARCKPWRQISTAAGDGSVAAIAVENYLEKLKRG